MTPKTDEPNKPANQLTPLTDEQVLAWTTQDGSEIVHTDHARQLERELAEARAEARRSKSIELEVADIQEAHDKIYAFALKTVEENEALEKRVAALEADKRRLDWLEGGGLDQRETRVFNIWNGGGMKFRAAIDAAIKEDAK
jgi:hypothetical protein